MKKYLLLGIALGLLMVTQAQTTVTVDGTKVTVTGAVAGTLYDALITKLTVDERGVINQPVTELTLSGTINAKDFGFKIMGYPYGNTSIKMILQKIDLSGVTAIEAYEGNEGPSGSNTVYPAAELPAQSLGIATLETAILPKNGVITSIGASAFAKAALTTLELPEGITDIKQGAFSQTKLTSITLPESLVTPTGTGVFSSAADLKEVKLPSRLTEIPNSWFNRSGLTTINAPATLKSIGYSAFANTPLTVADFPSVEYLGARAFQNATELTTVNLPGLKKWNTQSTFVDATKLKTVNMPLDATLVHADGYTDTPNEEKAGTMQQTFAGSGIERFTVPAAATVLDETFAWAPNLKTVDFQENALLTTVTNSAFSATKVADLNLPASVTTLGANAFSGHGWLKSVILGENVESLGNNAFNGASALEILVSKSTFPPTVGTSAFAQVPAEAILYVPAANVADYKAADGWRLFSDIRPMEPGKQVQTIAWGEDVMDYKLNKVYGDFDFEPSAVSSGGAPLTYTVSDESVATITDNTVRLLKHGATTITATQAGTDAYYPRSSTINLEVSKFGAENFKLLYELNFSDREAPAAALHKEPVYAGVTPGKLAAVGVESPKNYQRLIAYDFPKGSTLGSTEFTGTIDVSKYFGFDLKAPEGYQFSASAIQFIFTGGNLGQAEWRGSADNYAAALPNYKHLDAGLKNDAGVITIPEGYRFGQQPENNLLLPAAYDGVTSAAFRLYFYNCLPDTEDIRIFKGVERWYSSVNEKYVALIVDGFFEKVRAAQTISGLADMEKLTSDEPFDLPQNTEQGLPIAYAVSNPAVATVEGNRVTVVGAGEAEITARQFGSDAYSTVVQRAQLTVRVGSGLWEVSNSANFALVGNPVTTEARFTFASAGSGARVVLTDLTGKTVGTAPIAAGATSATLSTNHLRHGLYIARYTDNTGTQGMAKVIVE